MARKGKLQRQGVPVPERLTGPRRSTMRTVQRRAPIQGPDGGTRTETVRTSRRGTHRVVTSRTPTGRMGETQTEVMTEDTGGRRVKVPNPANASIGAGMLEAEFIAALGLLILLMFANSSASYGDRIMSLMKRGTLTCLLFFILALISSTGEAAAKIAKAFGALIIVAILLTSPVNTVMTDIDSLIKNDWTSTGENAGDSADTGTQQGTSSTASGVLGQIEKELQTMTGGQTQPSNPLSASGITQDVKNAAKELLNGIVPGLGNVIP